MVRLDSMTVGGAGLGSLFEHGFHVLVGKSCPEPAEGVYQETPHLLLRRTSCSSLPSGSSLWISNACNARRTWTGNCSRCDSISEARAWLRWTSSTGAVT